VTVRRPLLRGGALLIAALLAFAALAGACSTSSTSGSEYSRALESLLSRTFQPKLTTRQAHCAAPKIAGIVGSGAFKAHDLTPARVRAAKNVGDLDLRLDEPHATRVVNALFDCIDLGSITVEAAQSASADVKVDARGEHCLAVQLSRDHDFRAAFVADFTGSATASATGGLALLRAFGTCKVLLFDEASYADAVKPLFAQQTLFNVTDTQAKCLATGFVKVLTVARLEAHALTPANVADSTSITTVRTDLSAAEIEHIGALFATCLDLVTSLRTVFTTQLASTHPTPAFIDCIATHAAADPELRALIARTLLGDQSGDLATLGVRLGAQYRTQCA
jgi:hypothetical protein